MWRQLTGVIVNLCPRSYGPISQPLSPRRFCSSWMGPKWICANVPHVCSSLGLPSISNINNTLWMYLLCLTNWNELKFSNTSGTHMFPTFNPKGLLCLFFPHQPSKYNMGVYVTCGKSHMDPIRMMLAEEDKFTFSIASTVYKGPSLCLQFSWIKSIINIGRMCCSFWFWKT